MKWMPVYTVLVLLTTNPCLAFDPCKNSIVHKPMAGVEYNPSPIIVPDPVLIPLTIDMAKYYNIDLPDGVELNSQIGMIEIYKDGRILYDKEDISGSIKEECEHDITTTTDEEKQQPESKEDKNSGNTDKSRELSRLVPSGN